MSWIEKDLLSLRHEQATKGYIVGKMGKFSLDTAKLIIGGVILAGIMRTAVSPECRRL